MNPIKIVFSQNPIDQQHLGKTGGSITFTSNGHPVFQFENRAQYEQYLRLKKAGEQGGEE
ncbi:hypothetical protein GXP75_03230 [Bacillus sp. HU-1818]|uniref:hypothetical protein n=1 Tax=Bacillus TaxID=1386 RepID=UPI0012394686|nr:MULTISPECIES: hypothetical protein [Bacillus]KAA6453929.1 hypothetical protein DX926_05695 [Bacillus atrophaeus]MBT2624715.1 hypothetical protein [Bacillus sp. ISL-32]MCI3194710.1 hypothetical protein [Bacillus sp. HU-1818]